MDFDPRDYDSRDEERVNSRAGKGSSRHDYDREADLSLAQVRSRDRDDGARKPGRGPGDSRQSNTDEYGRDPRDDARGPERDRDSRDRDFDPREPFARDLNLPSGREREIVHDSREREYTLRGSPTCASNTRSPTAAGTTRT